MKRAILVLCILAVVAAEVLVIEKCDGVPEEICTISEARIEPCQIRKNNCWIKKGTNRTMSFDYDPNFSASSLKTMVYWVSPSLGDVFFDGFGSDNGCDYTPCPVEPGKSQRFEYNLNIGKKLPKGLFKLKWKVWNEENKDQVCCFQTTIKLLA